MIHAFQSFSKPTQIKYEIKILLKILRNRYLRKDRKIRTKDQILADYDENAWKKVLESKYWLKAKDLKDFCSMVTPVSDLKSDTELVSLVDGQIGKTTLPYMYKYTSEKICKIVGNYIADIDEIVELGCGFGLRLFPFRAYGMNNPLEGYDVSPNAINSAKAINEHFGCNIKFGIIDLTKHFDQSVLNNKTVFTNHCLEQLKYFTENVISNLVKGKPKQVLHFEPVRELFGFDLYDLVYKQHNTYADYQNNLLSTLKKFERKKLIKITKAERLRFNGNPFNETSFIRWVPYE